MIFNFGNKTPEIIPYQPEGFGFSNDPDRIQKLNQLISHKDSYINMKKVEGNGIIFLYFDKNTSKWNVVALKEKSGDKKDLYMFPNGQYSDQPGKNNKRCHPDDTYFTPFLVLRQIDGMRTEVYEEFLQYLGIPPPDDDLILRSPLNYNRTKYKDGEDVPLNNRGYIALMEIKNLDLKKLRNKIKERNKDSRTNTDGCKEMVDATLIPLKNLLGVHDSGSGKRSYRVKDKDGKNVDVASFFTSQINSFHKFGGFKEAWDNRNFENTYRPRGKEEEPTIEITDEDVDLGDNCGDVVNGYRAGDEVQYKDNYGNDKIGVIEKIDVDPKSKGLLIDCVFFIGEDVVPLSKIKNKIEKKSFIPKPVKVLDERSNIEVIDDYIEKLNYYCEELKTETDPYKKGQLEDGVKNLMLEITEQFDGIETQLKGGYEGLEHNCNFLKKFLQKKKNELETLKDSPTPFKSPSKPTDLDLAVKDDKGLKLKKGTINDVIQSNNDTIPNKYEIDGKIISEKKINTEIPLEPVPLKLTPPTLTQLVEWKNKLEQECNNKNNEPRKDDVEKILRDIEYGYKNDENNEKIVSDILKNSYNDIDVKEGLCLPLLIFLNQKIRDTIIKPSPNTGVYWIRSEVLDFDENDFDKIEKDIDKIDDETKKDDDVVDTIEDDVTDTFDDDTIEDSGSDEDKCGDVIKELDKDDIKILDKIKENIDLLSSKTIKGWDNFKEILLEPIRAVYFAGMILKDKELRDDAFNSLKEKLSSIGKIFTKEEFDKEIKEPIIENLSKLPLDKDEDETIKKIIKDCDSSKSKVKKFDEVLEFISKSKGKIKKVFKNIGKFFEDIFETISDISTVLVWAIRYLSTEDYKKLKDEKKKLKDSSDDDKMKVWSDFVNYLKSNPKLKKVWDAFESLKKSIESSTSKVFTDDEWIPLSIKILEGIFDLIDTDLIKRRESKRLKDKLKESAVTRRELKEIKAIKKDTDVLLSNLGIVTRVGVTVVNTSESDLPEPTFDVVEVLSPLNSNIIYKETESSTPIAYKLPVNTARLYKYRPDYHIGHTFVFADPAGVVKGVYIKVSVLDDDKYIRVNKPLSDTNENADASLFGVGAFVYIKNIGKFVLPSWNIPLTKYT